ncbi:MAG: ABC transporter ATP-binding protein [Clostridiales Family XIII bacterium]|jgi:ABC-2 type transport system ATP-binding protein|nr:ABC transporter ATP-binding protein [Clostridiales Family XIII bacterium]
MNNILEVRDLRKSYGAFTLKDISFDVPKGYICGFVGPNGAGKTTTIKMILNIVRAESGSVKISGKDHGTESNDKIGVVMDMPMYVDEWTVADAGSAVSPFYAGWDSEKYAEYLHGFGLDPKKKVNELSRGMKIKLQIAAALSHDARLLILDEPTSGLDPAARDEICDLLREFVTDEDKSILFSTHITSDLEKVADYITFILDGEIVFTGRKDDLLEKYVRVTGGPEDAGEEHKKLIIGYREYGEGFEGMIETANIGKLPRGVPAEAVNLEEIIVFMNRGNALNDEA